MENLFGSLNFGLKTLVEREYCERPLQPLVRGILRCAPVPEPAHIRCGNL